VTSISRPLLWAFWTGLAVLTLIVLAWAGGILFWHVRVAQALHSWDKSFVDPQESSSTDFGISQDDSRLLDAAGCRGLPQLVRAFEATDDPNRQDAFFNRILGILIQAARANDEESSHLLKRWVDRWYSTPFDPVTMRKRRAADVKAWWAENGSRVHRWWRFWSSWCLRD